MALLVAPALPVAAAPAPPPADDPLATLVRSDPRSPAAARATMREGVAVVASDRRGSGWPPVLRARGRRARRVPGMPRARLLAGSPLRIDEHVRVRRRYASRHTQIVAAGEAAGLLVYARFRLPSRSGISATLHLRRTTRGPSLRLTVRGVVAAPVVERQAVHPPPPVPPPPPPPPLPAPAAAPPAEDAGAVLIRECGSVAPADASDAEDFDRLWHLDRNGPGWTGGDGVFSVPFEDGRVAWLFGDSFIAGVLPDGRRDADWHLVRNTVVVQDGACLTTAVGGTPEAPAALVRPPSPEAWYWPQDAVADGSVLRVMMLRVVRTGPTAWDFDVTGVDLVDLDLGNFAATRIASLPGDGSILWGTSVLEASDSTYVYGVEDVPLGARVYLARTSEPRLRGEWSFYAGAEAGWTTDPEAAEPLLSAGADGGAPVALTGVSSAISVVEDGPGVVLVSQAPAFGQAVSARRAPAPEGPYGPPQQIATAAPPDAPDAFTYGARLHPDLAAEGLQLLSWNVSSFGDLLAQATLYRPRFAAVAWPPGASATRP